MSPHTEKKIQRAYFTRKTSVRKLAKEFEVSRWNVNKALKRVRKQALENQQYMVIKVAPKWIEGISHLLTSRGIDHEIPRHFELIEKYESRLSKSEYKDTKKTSETLVKSGV